MAKGGQWNAYLFVMGDMGDDISYVCSISCSKWEG